ncbi:MAG: DNA primase [Oscillospiraceae bacterium]|nr:DNA primase [Oscillospiraceae bacterium]
MALPESFLQQLKLSCDIESIISSYVTVKRQGRNRACLCPFHSEKTPSMVIYNDTQSFYCFGCGAGGDVITFIMKIENLEYIEAVKFLADRAGLQMPETGVDDSVAKLKMRILEMNREAARFFHSCLISPIGQAGMEYLKRRQLTDETIKKFGLGYAPNSWDSLRKHLRAKGYTDEEMYKAFLVGRSQKGTFFDIYRNRVIFPIMDLRGNVIAFGGRVLDDSKPKYLNSGDTLVFKKTKNLFCLNLAKNEIKDRLILAEGYMDVIAMYQAGFHNVVATLGTALTQDQARMISGYVNEVILSYDSDEAGQTATKRAVGLLSAEGVKARVLKIEGAKDPDEYIKKFGSTRFKLLLDGSDNATDYELARLKQQFDTDTAAGQADYLKAAINQVLSNLTTPVERDVYAGKLSKETGVSRETILAQVDTLIRKKRYTKEKKEWQDIQSGKQYYSDRVNPQKAANKREAIAEERILAFLYRDNGFSEYILERLDEDSFVTDFNRRLFGIIAEKLQHNITLDSLSGELTPTEMAKLTGYLAQNADLKNLKDELDDDIDVLIKHKNRLTSDKIAGMDVEALSNLAKELRSKKSRN